MELACLPLSLPFATYRRFSISFCLVVESWRLMLGQFHGTGTLKFPDGRKFEGEWANGARNGKGVLYLKDGVDRFDGTWIDDKPKEGVWKFRCGTASHTACSFALLPIVDIGTHRTGVILECKYVNGKREGKATLANGSAIRYQVRPSLQQKKKKKKN
jgi:hypothetical protein